MLQCPEETNSLQAEEPDELRQRRQLQLLLFVVVDVVVGVVLLELGQLSRKLVVSFEVSFALTIEDQVSNPVSLDLERPKLELLVKESKPKSKPEPESNTLKTSRTSQFSQGSISIDEIESIFSEVCLKKFGFIQDSRPRNSPKRKMPNAFGRSG